jgi:NADPH:quinone reductase-like Zn-dependent oxidoreductase
MRAIVWTGYGPPDVLEPRDLPQPESDDGDVLIRIRAAAATMGDVELRSLALPAWVGLPIRIFLGYRRPKRRLIPGAYLAGEIESVGRAVTRWKPGDRVFGTTGFAFGAYAEYQVLPEGAALAPMPAGLSFEEAAAIPLGGLNAQHFLAKAELRPGERVLINGAAGSIGTFAIQLAKWAGAEVTGVDSTPKLDHMRAVGADHVIDYTREDLWARPERFHVVLDVVGRAPLGRFLGLMEPGGRFLMANPRPPQMLAGLWAKRTGDKRVVMQAASETAAGLRALAERIERGEIRPVVGRAFPLERAVEAHRHLESGEKVGEVVLTV